MRGPYPIVPFLLGAVLAAGAGGCSGEPRIEIHGQEARLSSMFGGAASVFLTVRNPGSGGDVLVGASVDVPGAVAEIHDVKDGRMVPGGRVRVPARGGVELRPGGLHIMVFNLPRSIAAGAELGLRLQFERSGEKRTSVKIRG